MLEPDDNWPDGPHDVTLPEPWPPADLPPGWPRGADPEYVRLEATWGDQHCQALIEAIRQHQAGVAADGEHRALAAYATDGGASADD